MLIRNLAALINSLAIVKLGVLSYIVEAQRYLEKGHKKGSVVLTVEHRKKFKTEILGINSMNQE